MKELNLEELEAKYTDPRYDDDMNLIESPHGETTTALQPYQEQKPRAGHIHFQALDLRPGVPAAMIAKKLAMLTSYTGAPSVLLDAYVNMTIVCRGIMLLDVDPFVDRTTGEAHEGYTLALLKITDPETGKPVIVRTSSRQCINLAREILLPYVGWFDWEQPIQLLVRRNGQAYGLQFLEEK